MKKNNELKKDILAIIFYIIIYLLIYAILTSNNHIFGSNTDFKVQHYLIPEYFRTLFYDTKDLLPDFAPNLGSGQNIYYLSYYGLLSPIILISYLLPSIKMLDYIIISTSIMTLLAVTLFYFFLKKHNFDFKTRFLTAFLFLCAAPLIFHAKRHIMFINYLPFLIIGLWEIDKYFEKKNTLILSISIALILYTSYFYSISCLVSLFIYFVYKCIKQKKQILKETFKIALPVINGIFLASIIIFPSLYCLLNSRKTSSNAINITQLLTPKSFLLYSSYSMGLSLISLIALISQLKSSKKEIKFLSLTILIITTIPLFNYILNGMLYINGKSLIPLIPITLIVTATFLQKLNKQGTKFIFPYIIISSLAIVLLVNCQDKLMLKEDINNKYYKASEYLTNYITNKDKSIYRINNLVSSKETINKITNISEYKTTIYSSTYNKNYKEFYYKDLHNNKPFRNDFMISASNNILSQSILGEKYIITTTPLTNLELIKEKDEVYLYKNNNALPIGYTTTNIINEKNYNNLPYPTNTLVLLNNIITQNTQQHPQIPIKNEVNLTYEILEKENLEILNTQQKTKIIAKDNSHIKIKLNTNPHNKIILLKFTNTYNPEQDLTITINNEMNTLTSKSWKYNNKNLTFNYYIYNTNILDIYLKKGTYSLKDFKTYIIDYSEISKNNIEPFKINKKKTKGDKIIGTMNIKNDSYFNISIPYDKGFKILVNNKKVKYEKTNKNFIGFPLKKGNNYISIEYEAPYKKIAIILSTINLLLLPIIQIIYKKRRN